MQEHQTVGKVVNVLRCAGEMDELARRSDLDTIFQPFPKPIFDSLDVVVRARFYELDCVSIRFGKICGETIELIKGRIGESRHFRDSGGEGQRLEPFDFDLHAVTNQSKFAEIRPESRDFAVVTPVQWRQGRKRRRKRRRIHVFDPGFTGKIILTHVELAGDEPTNGCHLGGKADIIEDTTIDAELLDKSSTSGGLIQKLRADNCSPRGWHEAYRITYQSVCTQDACSFSGKAHRLQLRTRGTMEPRHQRSGVQSAWQGACTRYGRWDQPVRFPRYC